MVHGRFFKRGLSYWTGVFDHDGDNARSKKIQGGDETFAARLAATPFRQVGVPGLELGGAFTVSALSDDSFRPNGLRGRTVMTQDTFYDPVYVKGRRQRWEGDVDWNGVRCRRAANTPTSSISACSRDLPTRICPMRWRDPGTSQAPGSSPARRRCVRSSRPTICSAAGSAPSKWPPATNGCGSAASARAQAFRNPRAEHMLPSGDRVLTLGVNWTLNRFVKLQVNAIRERVEDLERSPVPNGAAFWSRVLRLQFVL